MRPGRTSDAAPFRTPPNTKTTTTTTTRRVGGSRRWMGVAEEYRSETERAGRFVDGTLASTCGLGGLTRDGVLREIEAAAVRGGVGSAAGGGTDATEMGPAGLYLYRAEDDGLTGRRAYRRVPASDRRGEGPAAGAAGRVQDVLRVNFQTHRLGPVSLSVDEECVAYVTESALSDAPSSRVAVRHIDSGREFVLRAEDGIHRRAEAVEFGPALGDGRHELYYTAADGLGRPDSAHRCVFDGVSGFTAPECVLCEPDGSFFVDVSRTKGRRFVAIQSSSKTTNEVRLAGGGGEPVLVRRREGGVQYYVDCGDRDDDIIVMAHLSGEGGPDLGLGLGEEMSVFQASAGDLPLGESFGVPIHLDRSRRASEGRAAYPECGTYFVEDMDLFAEYLALYERSSLDGSQRIRVMDRHRSREDWIVPLPPEAGDLATVAPGGNAWYGATTLRFSVESPAAPPVAYECDMVDREVRRASRRGPEDDDGDIARECRHERVFATSRDGTAVPVTLVYRERPPGGRGIRRRRGGSRGDSGGGEAGRGGREGRAGGGRRPEERAPSPRPAVLVGYGAYGQSQDMSYDPAIAPLLDRGFVVAYAHTRGGGDLGRSWYRAGRAENKERAVEDYIACAEALLEWGITSRDMLAARAFSAGGAIVGSAVCRRPSLFKAAALTNAFLDVTGAMSDPSLPLTEHERDEWGDPLADDGGGDVKERMGRFCPLANVVGGRSYPRMLIVGAMDDERVPCWHAATFARKVRALHRDDGQGGGGGGDVAHLHVEERGGHHLHGRRLEVAALEVSFLLGQLTGEDDDDDSRVDERGKSPLGEGSARSIFRSFMDYFRSK